MAVLIPLPWQLTDFLCALGLGALYGAVYRWGVLLLPQGRLRKKARRVLTGVGELLWTLAAALFTRAWVLTGSRAAQLRWTVVLGILLGMAAFHAGMVPVLKRLDDLLLQLFSPLRRLFFRVGRAAAAVRSRRRQTAQKRQTMRAARRERRDADRMKKATDSRRSHGKKNGKKSQKIFPENAKKELQSKEKMYYNNL